MASPSAPFSANAGALPVLTQLLASSTATDVQEAIQLLTFCVKFDIAGSDAAARKMLPLIFGREQSAPPPRLHTARLFNLCLSLPPTCTHANADPCTRTACLEFIRGPRRCLRTCRCAGTRDAIVDAAYDLYLRPEDGAAEGGAARDRAAAQNLISLALSASIGERATDPGCASYNAAL